MPTTYLVLIAKKSETIIKDQSIDQPRVLLCPITEGQTTIEKGILLDPTTKLPPGTQLIFRHPNIKLGNFLLGSFRFVLPKQIHRVKEIINNPEKIEGGHILL